MSALGEGQEVRQALRFLVGVAEEPPPCLGVARRGKGDRQVVADWLAERWLALLERVERLERR